jgi:hypothetical protein
MVLYTCQGEEGPDKPKVSAEAIEKISSEKPKKDLTKPQTCDIIKLQKG